MWTVRKKPVGRSLTKLPYGMCPPWIASVGGLSAAGAAVLTSVRARHAEYVLAEVGEDQVVRDRRDRVEPRLPELSLDVEVGGEAGAAVRIEAGVRGEPRRLGGEQLRHVRLGAAVCAPVEEARRLAADEIGRVDGGVGAGDRELHALVGGDRTAEDDPFRRVARGPVDEPAAVAYALGGDQDALRVHAVEDLAEPASLHADERVGRKLDAVEEHLRRRVVQHR